MLLDGVNHVAVITSDTERFHAFYRDVFDAVVSLLHQIAEAHPLILVLDDLHWADAATLQLLRHVARSTEQTPLLRDEKVEFTLRELERIVDERADKQF